MNISKLDRAINNFLEKRETNKSYYEENRDERKERKNFYQTFTKEKLLAMSEDTFFEYIGKLWAMLIWGNKQYAINKLVKDNGFDNLKRELAEFLYGNESLENRWDTFFKSVKGLGPATMSELLTYINPQEYVIFNKITILCFTYLDIPNMPKYN